MAPFRWEGTTWPYGKPAAAAAWGGSVVSGSGVYVRLMP